MMPWMRAPVSRSEVVPESEPFGAPGAGGGSKFATGRASSPSSVPANQPIPRWANTAQIVAWWAPPLRTMSACRIALRSSRNDGLKGESSMARVTRPSVVSEPSASRRSHRVCTQISPSEWTSGPPATRPKSP